MKLSLCMIVRDEAEHLARSLESVRHVVDEMVVVDTGSTDDTVAIARSFGAAVHALAWPDSFALARNASLDRATGDWILVLDADEELDPAAAGRLRDRIPEVRADGLQLIQRSFLPPGDLARYHDLRVLRLFRNDPSYRYEAPIHEQIQPSILRAGGRVEATGLVLRHHGYARPTAQGGNHRARRNLSLLERAVAEAPEDAYLQYQLGITYKALGDVGRARERLRCVLALEPEGLGPDVLGDLYMKLSQIELADDHYEPAIEYAGRCLRYWPENVVALYVLAVGHMLSGAVREAYPFFQRVRRSPNCSPSSRAELDAVLAHCRARLPEGAGTGGRA